MIQKSTIIAIISCIIGIPILVFSAHALYISKYSSVVMFVIAPQSIDVTYGDTKKTIDTEAMLRLTPGEYTFSFAKEGFMSQSRKITLQPHAQTNIPVVLAPQTDAATALMDTDENQTALQGIADMHHAHQEDLSKHNPTISMLPFENFLFKIDYYVPKNDPTGAPYIITIDAEPGYRQSAINKLKEWGYTPSDYKIEYINYNNPFTS